MSPSESFLYILKKFQNLCLFIFYTCGVSSVLYSENVLESVGSPFIAVDALILFSSSLLSS